MHMLCGVVICHAFILCETACMRPLLWQHSVFSFKRFEDVVRLYNDLHSLGLHIPFKVSQNEHYCKSLTLQHPHCFTVQSTCKIYKTKQVWVSGGQSNLCPNVYMKRGCKLKCYWPTGLTGSDKSNTGRKHCCLTFLSTINLAVYK